MNNQLKILVVEDNDDMFENYQDSIEEINHADLTINLERKTSVDGAMAALLSNEFDGAIIDLNLNQESPMETSGNDVLLEIVGKHRFPVLVVSGNIQNITDELRGKESEFLKFHGRETSNEIIFNHFIDIFKTGITKILGGRGLMDKYLGEIFWKHLSHDFRLPLQPNQNPEKILLRYAVSHLAEYLDIPNGEDQFYHEAEVYIKPPIRCHIATGDIVENNNKRYIVLSPACDIAVRSIENATPEINANQILLAPLIKIDRDSFIEEGIMRETDNSSKRKKIVEDIIKGKREKFGFLPEHEEMYPAVIDFQNIHTCQFSSFGSYNRLATVSGMFLKDIQSKFSSYVGRQGQPDLNKENLIDRYKPLLDSQQNAGS